MEGDGNNYPGAFGVKYISLSWKTIANDFNIDWGLNWDVFHEMNLFVFKAVHAGINLAL